MSAQSKIHPRSERRYNDEEGVAVLSSNRIQRTGRQIPIEEEWSLEPAVKGAIKEYDTVGEKNAVLNSHADV
jgi:predicted methyltransferase MtxX (methanogen marker protein 4)